MNWRIPEHSIVTQETFDPRSGFASKSTDNSSPKSFTGVVTDQIRPIHIILRIESKPRRLDRRT